ncbi:hypothetical protein CDAR_533731 [Caerostris darwini]|uniref:Uncharacterized protein n=1 Tax=Caerostris darwini TaxID=1538125 RepID=A0AAV4S7C4_9ARAC|nr:hypothetical protein CDAR_533731 [Caerostris darwini]
MGTITVPASSTVHELDTLNLYGRRRLKTENIKPLLSLCGTKQEKSYLGKKSLSNAGLVRIGGGKVPVQSRYRWIVLQMHDPELKGGGSCHHQGFERRRIWGSSFQKDVVWESPIQDGWMD